MIVVLADDLSGAAELAGAALRHGLTAEVQSDFDPGSRAEVVCVDTDTRSLDAAQAEAVAAEAARRVSETSPEWIYKKCDSVLRGHVGREARGIARAVGATDITVLSANPSRDRIIRGGRYFVGGKPLDATVFAHDPEHPRRTASVTELLGGDLASIHAPDAVTVADVAIVAGGTARTTLPVGGVDYFEALLACRRGGHSAPDHRAEAMRTAVRGTRLLICGSAASWMDRSAAAHRQGIRIFPMPHDIDSIVRAMRGEQEAVVGIGDHPVTLGIAPPALVTRLAATVAEVALATPVDHLLLEGGATAKAVVRALGWNRLIASVRAPEGVGVFTPADSKRAALTLYIKPGSYAWPAGLWPGR